MMVRVTIAAIGLTALMAVPALAGQLVYQPTNPTFGGNPLNGSFLLSTAQTQGAGVKSGQQQTPDLSGLNDALGNLGNVNQGTGSTGTSPIIVIGNGQVPANP
ncbi:curli assembly protein CsgF [Rhizobium sp. P40RR-XXII]|uniref:curli assembly protein CsgF n=1 Tax=Rhizobium sp. P40RR-XXII TaxID=2726739 RepID=UPI001456841C|nr:curli assembly protein CsgF [Rhizobium sp. P40RR-XXII]NLS17604.1 curli assembly protein CsgF [Rhizobium sp. P40RR-XXII]